MAQQFDYPKTETQLREIQDKLYQHSKEVYDAGGRPAFKGLLEIMSAEATIITAIHNIKSNRGSETPGVDSKTMRRDYLQKPFPWVVRDIQKAFRRFEPQKIRRVYIDKPGKAEKRPLGIPTIRDRIVQECMRIVLEPIFEAQFFAHSYGFRPMRDAAMALERIDIIMHNSGQYWIVEGDISKCFDRIDHAILLKRLLSQFDCADDRGMAEVKQRIASMESSLEKLNQGEKKYTAELDDALTQYAELRHQATDIDTMELNMARQAIQPNRDRETVQQLQAAYGKRFDSGMLAQSRKDVTTMMDEATEPVSVRQDLQRLYEHQNSLHHDKKPGQER